MTNDQSNNNNNNQMKQQQQQKYRMVAFDLDGTLLRGDHQISDYAVEYLRYLHHEKGFLVCIASGRSPAAIAEVIKRLNFDFPQPHSKKFPVVSSNGAKGLHVYHESFVEEEKDDDKTKNKGDNNSLDDADATADAEAEEEEKKTEDEPTATRPPLSLDWKNNPMVDGRMKLTELFHQPVPMDMTRKALALAKSMGCPTNYYFGHDIYAQLYEDWNLEACEFYSKLTGTKFTYVEDDYEQTMRLGLPSKLLVNCKPEDIDETYQKIKSELGDELMIIRGSPPNFVEILRKDVCKGNGLKLLCERLDVPLEECIAFGDGDNDIEFVEMAGLGIAMKNARDTLKAVADGITEQTNNDDGAIRMLQQLESDGKLIFMK